MQSTTAIYEYFHVPNPIPERNFRAKCKLCRKSYSTSRMVTSNLVRHMKKQHPSVYVKRNLTSSQVELRTLPPLPAFAQPSTYPSEHPQQLKFEENVIQLLSTGLLHPDTIHLREFEALVNGLDSNIICPPRQHISDVLLPNAVNNVRSNILSVLNTTKDICLIINLGTVRRNLQSFIGISATCITNWTKQTFLLSCSYFEGRHTPLNLLHAYSQTVELYSIAAKVAFVVNDHASNIAKAINLHKFCELPTEDDNLSPIFGDGCGKLPQFPHHVHCFAHDLQLALNDGFKAADISIQRLLKKTTALIEKISQSAFRDQILRDEDFQANKPRWSSIRSVLNAPSVLFTQSCSEPILCKAERKLLTNLVDIFEPIEDVVDKITVNKEPNSNIVILTVLVLERHLATFMQQKSLPTAISTIVSVLQESIECKLKKYAEDNDFIAAVVLDPRYKTSWSVDPAAPREALFNIVHSFEEKLREHGFKLEELRFDQPKKTKIDFSSLVIKKETISLSTVQELERYLEEPLEGQDSDILTYWKNAELRFPKLGMLARKYLALSATPVEQVCGSGIEFSSMSSDNRVFEMLTFLKCNKK